MVNRAPNDSPKLNPELTEFRLQKLEDAVKENTQVTNTILQEVRSLAYVPVHEFAEYKEVIESKFQAAQSYGERVYRKKDDGKALRAFGVSVITALTITVATMVIIFVGKGIFQ